jgi:hypothetical protein
MVAGDYGFKSGSAEPRSALCWVCAFRSETTDKKGALAGVTALPFVGLSVGAF